MRMQQPSLYSGQTRMSPPPEAGDDQAAEVKPDARTGFEGVDLGEVFEHPLLLFGRDADARVADADLQRAPGLVVAATERDASCGGELGGVMQQVVDDARQVEGIGGYLDLRSCFVDVFDRRIVAELLLQLQPFGAEQADVGLGDRERAFGTDELREFEHVFQQGGQGRGALPDLGLKSLPGRRLLFREQQFGEAVDGVQRRAYLVAHRVDEGGLHFFALLGAAALALRLFAGRHELRASQLQPPDHRLLVGGPAGEQQHDAAGDKQEEFVAVGQPGLFEFEAVDVVERLHLGQLALRLVHAAVVAEVVAFPHGFEGFCVIARLFIQVRLRYVDGAEIRLFAGFGVVGQQRIHVGRAPLVVAPVPVITGAGVVYLLAVAAPARQLHAFVVVAVHLLPGEEAAQEDHLAVGPHQVFRRVAAGAFETFVGSHPRAVQVDAPADLTGGARIVGVEIDVCKFLAAEFFEVDAFLQRVFFELGESLLHIGDGLGNVAVGFGGDRRIVDGESREEFPFDLLLGGEAARLPLAELRQRAVDRLERVGHRHLLPEPEGVERCTEQREAAVGQEAVRKADVLQSPFGLLRRESLHEPVQRLPASVVVSGSGGFGECGFPVEGGERRAVGAEVGQPDIGLLPFGGRARPGQRCGQAVGFSGCCERRRRGAEGYKQGPGEGFQRNRTHLVSLKRYEIFAQI